MAIPSLFESYIDETYQRLVQYQNGEFADGTGSAITFGTTAPAGPNGSIQFNGNGVFSGSSNFIFNSGSNSIILTGSLLATQSYISTVDYIDFSLLTTHPPQNEGRLFWNSDIKTLQLDLEQNFHTDLNQQLLVRVVNKTGDALPIGTVVYISGSQGNRPGIATASYTGDQTSAATIGFTAKTINHNNNGYVITRGILDGVNTAAYAVGTPLYLSSSGQFTNVAPDAPLHEVRLGKVIVSDVTSGSIYVDVMNGYELDELHDVKATNPSYGDLFMASGSLWTATKTLSGSYTLSGSLSTNDGVSVQTLTASVISASQITGSLFGTSSWATNAISSSFPIAVTGSTLYSVAPFSNNLWNSNTTLNNIFLGANAGNQATNAIHNVFLGTNAGDKVPNVQYSNFIGFQAGSGSTNAQRSNFIGFHAGSGSTNAFFSNFIGSGSGATAINAESSNFIGGRAGFGATNASQSNFLGTNAGFNATNANNSNFIGQQAGSGSTSAAYSNFLGWRAGSGATSANNSNFFGISAGEKATSANNSNFFGNAAGQEATFAASSNFIGGGAGFSATQAASSNFLGNGAGAIAIFANDSNFLGYQAGITADNANNSNFLGFQAGHSATYANNSNFLGQQAGSGSSNAYRSNFLGWRAGSGATNAYNSNFLGERAGVNATNASLSNFLGLEAGNGVTNADNSNFLGQSAGISATNANNSNFIGNAAGSNGTNASGSNFIGRYAGRGASSASFSNFIGYNAGWNPIGGTSPHVGPNNIIIGTNITLANGRQDSINIGGIIFGTGSYSTTTGNPFSGSADGRIGINTVTPTRNFEVSGTVAFPSLTPVTYPTVVSIDTATGQLYYQSALSGSGGGSVTVQYTGSTAELSASILNFTGSGVSVTGGGGIATIEITGGGGGGGTPGGADTNIQYNSGGTTFAGDAEFTWNTGTKTAGVRGNLNIIDATNSLATSMFAVNTTAIISGSGGFTVVDVDTALYRYCSVQYYILMEGGSSRSGRLTLNVPVSYDYTSANPRPIKLPLIDESTEYYTGIDNISSPTFNNDFTTEDVIFSAYWGGSGIRIILTNNNPTYTADFRSQITLI